MFFRVIILCLTGSSLPCLSFFITLHLSLFYPFCFLTLYVLPLSSRVLDPSFHIVSIILVALCCCCFFRPIQPLAPSHHFQCCCLCCSFLGRVSSVLPVFGPEPLSASVWSGRIRGCNSPSLSCSDCFQEFQ